MYTGQNSLRFPTKWALNAAAYDNIAADQVDWAALAQQWIQMKETNPSENLAPPPPPNISSISVRPPPAPAWNSSSWTFSGQQTWPQANSNNWNWNNSVNVNAPPPPIISNIEVAPKEGPVVPILPTPTFNTFAPQAIPPAYSVVQPPKEYWTVSEHSVKDKSNVAFKGSEGFVQAQNFPDTGITLDAAKRKQLPAWIRQGLEKMEREKQKQLEKEQDLEQKRIMLEQKRLAEEQALKEIQQEGSIIGMKSKFESESDDEDINGKVIYEDEVQIPKHKTLTKVEKVPIITQYRTKEERLQDVMLCVRQTLTEILLDVTNDEILAISRDTIKRFRNSAQTLRKTNALTSITGGLGLGIYGESSGSESDNSDNENSDGGKDYNKDSDVELERTIRLRKTEFEKTSKEIEAHLEAEEEISRKNRQVESREQRDSDRVAAEMEIKSGRGDGEKCYKNSDADTKSSVAITHQSSFNRNKTDINKVEQDVDINERKNDSGKKSRYEKSQSSKSSSESDTDSDTDSDSNTSRSVTSQSTLSSKHSSREKRTNLCRKKSQKSASPERKRRTDKYSKNKDRKVYVDKMDIMSMKDSKVYTSLKKNDSKRSARERSRSPSVRSRSRSYDNRYKSASRDTRRRSRSREKRHRSRSVDSSVSREHKGTSRSDHRRSTSRTRSYSRDRKHRSRSRDRQRESSYSSSKRDRRYRSRSRSSRRSRSRSRSRGKRSHRR